ncbi:MAG TPA: RsmE family RNA methyltransferase [Chitinophagaceae bacterium]|nr:RsmE family RNA methyltransferase [Chitinophagaceae bacterium]
MIRNPPRKMIRNNPDLEGYAMEFPLFYAPQIGEKDTEFILDEANSRHCIQVLRKTSGDEVQLTNGCGLLFRAAITGPDRRACRMNLLSCDKINGNPYPLPAVAIGVPRHSPRLEWFLEKAVEVGVSEIFLLASARTFSSAPKTGRFTQIMISAMLQSRQVYLPILHPPVVIQELLHYSGWDQRFIAHCGEGDRIYLPALVKPGMRTLVLIGPEGDFTPAELELGKSMGLLPVSLGATRLRTETAALAALLMVHSVNLLHHASFR